MILLLMVGDGIEDGYDFVKKLREGRRKRKNEEEKEKEKVDDDCNGK